MNQWNSLLSKTTERKKAKRKVKVIKPSKIIQRILFMERSSGYAICMLYIEEFYWSQINDDIMSYLNQSNIIFTKQSNILQPSNVRFE